MIFAEASFPYEKTLLVALIGAVIGQSLIIIISWSKRKIDLGRKKQMIITDLQNQDKILDLVTEKYIELNELFNKKETDRFTSSAFHNLPLDIYQSVPKNELYSIFKKQLHDLVEIYKAIEFLKENEPYWIYKYYLEKSEHHLKENENKPDHIFLCDAELSFIEIAQLNIDNNLRTIKETKAKIKKLTK